MSDDEIDATEEQKERAARRTAVIAAIMDVAEHEFPNAGLVILTFDYGAGGVLNYISNAEPAAVIKAMREYIAKFTN